ncbi:NADH-FMN oxidoreductase RutF, flavin reductase (DIM6/NTAB) family [Geodermatophilus amargosae]|uniref:NADH-FMN oxidoreductase RutF, flavin reductase (DIM6/NTAB) family n=1 Tax=Geodermatophilus amargosae TaxID=1296565 RepID=A0A1I7B3U4_9ACTN|nr:flavin reductase [Geodermatophilus amargosae]SFT81859.1 NADH-FMN oxidoreductase RutF, flavin reductase (DIM6/NTAB) family [Geodermatophilus amargosae]
MDVDTAFDDKRFREVLGHLPTGVVVITAITPEGKPSGMVVGSFTSVSLDPPLVAFLPARTSSSFASLRKAHSFCVNILSAKQEPICRQFAVSGGDKFAGVNWSPAPSGAPVIDGVVAWIDCEFERIDEAGDHYIVLGRVTHLATGVPTIPLLFFQGGYGGFATTSLVMGASADMLHSLSIADRARAEIEALAGDVGFECYAQVPKGDQFVVIASVFPPLDAVPPWRIGMTFPVVPPWGEVFMAWAPRDEQIAWMNRIRTPADDRQRILDEMATIRSTGWSMTVWRSMADVDQISGIIAEHGHTPAMERQVAQLMRSTTSVAEVRSQEDVGRLDGHPTGSIASISAPVIGPDGELALMVNIHNIPVTTPKPEVQRCIQRLLEATARIAERLA